MSFTRSGKEFRATSSVVSVETRREMSEGFGESGVAEILKMLIEDRQRREEEQRRRESEREAEQRRREEEQRRRDAEREEEQRRLEKEHELRVRQMEAQLNTIQVLVEDSRRREAELTAERNGGNGDKLKLTKLTETEDIEAFLTTFERMMAVYSIEEERWAYKLAPLLTGKAQQAYAAMKPEDACKYLDVKAAVLRRYDISEETYRQRFRSTRRQESESYSEVVTRLGDLVKKWLDGCDTIEEVYDKLVIEQLMNVLPGEIRIWVGERKPTTGSAAGALADDYLQARRGSGTGEITSLDWKRSDKTRTESRKCHKCKQAGHIMRDCPQKDPPKNNHHISKEKPNRGAVKCYNCGRMGHVAIRCPNNVLFCGTGTRMSVRRQGVIEGTNVPDVILDTGCSQTMIRQDLVPAKKKLPGEAVMVRCAHGDTALYPLAEVEMELEGVQLNVKAAVSESLPVSVLLGTDVVELDRLLRSDHRSAFAGASGEAMVMTRTQAQREEEEELFHRTREEESGVQPHPVWKELEENQEPEKNEVEREEAIEPSNKMQEKPLEKHENQEPEKNEVGGEETNEPSDMMQEKPLENHQENQEPEGAREEAIKSLERTQENQSDVVFGSTFTDDLFDQVVEKKKLSRRGKREDKHKWGLVRALDKPDRRKEQEKSGVIGVNSLELRHLQETDESLATLRAEARDPVKTTSFWEDGILYRKWLPGGKEEEEVEQVVLPKSYRRTVLELAHSVPLGGHMGRKKTTARVQRRFFWPTMHRDIADFCRSCATCQKFRRHRKTRAPMIPLPVMAEPFHRIAMDILGPLPRSRSGNRYVLVVCDYATRYPEAVPLRSIEAEVIAEELMKIFARVGLPSEILTDQGSNFQSQLLAELYRLLHIEAMRTSPYHPQTDGLVERFNKTLKDMLKKTACEEGKDWDKLIPYLLFAYREVPQESSGFSPFELLYGRDVRGPLDVLRESWVTNEEGDMNVLSYILLMREKMDKMNTQAQVNLEEARARQKVWYDRNARIRKFLAGDHVLILLPSATSKLQAQWQGPYEIVRPVGKVNYMVRLHDRRMRHKVYHVNMLRKWHTQESNNYFVQDESEETDDQDEIPGWRDKAGGEPNIGDQLSHRQRDQLRKLLDKYREAFSENPGHTSLARHRIITGDHPAVRSPPYRLPQAFRECVREEIQEMLKNDIIEPSTSDWASPIVPILKKDKTLRLCVDYRKVNAISKVDAYPMPRVDEMIDQVGGAKYISTLDLTKGYWQVPVEEEDRVKTAFTTPFGLFQFKRMPFGLMGAPATFQRMVDRLLDGLGEFANAYIDDIVIFSHQWEDHLIQLRTVLELLREAGLTAKLRKCQFGMSECRYLGHVIGSGKVCPEEVKIRAIRNFEVPRTKKEVRAFLGLSGYYRRFIPDYSSTAAPLTDLTQKRKPTKVVWTGECDAAFQKLKDKLCSKPVMRSPNFEKEFKLQTDASERGVGAILSQLDENGQDHPVAYFSRKLLPRETRYSTIEKECLAIKLGIQAFYSYLAGRKFTIQTDHRSLEWLHRSKEHNSRLTRWSLFLQSFDFTITYRPGKRNANADALSRNNLGTNIKQV